MILAKSKFCYQATRPLRAVALHARVLSEPTCLCMCLWESWVINFCLLNFEYVHKHLSCMKSDCFWIVKCCAAPAAANDLEMKALCVYEGNTDKVCATLNCTSSILVHVLCHICTPKVMDAYKSKFKVSNKEVSKCRQLLLWTQNPPHPPTHLLCGVRERGSQLEDRRMKGKWELPKQVL